MNASIFKVPFMNQKKTKKPRTSLPLSAIEEEFRVQLKFLEKSCESYDSGDRDEFRRIALAVRILVHDTRNSKSIIGQLALQDLAFRSYSRKLNPKNMLSETPLVITRMTASSDGSEVTYLPRLDLSQEPPRMLSFIDWWNEDVFRSPNGVSMTRSGFILHTANEAGGAHVDSDLDEQFYKIARENEAGWIAIIDGRESPMVDLEKAYVRHIGFEILQSLNPAWLNIVANRYCDCGSGRKFRYCHGKNA